MLASSEESRVNMDSNGIFLSLLLSCSILFLLGFVGRLLFFLLSVFEIGSLALEHFGTEELILSFGLVRTGT